MDPICGVDTVPLRPGSATSLTARNYHNAKTPIIRKPVHKDFSGYVPMPLISDHPSIRTETQSASRLKPSQPPQETKLSNWMIQWHSPILMLSLMFFGILGMAFHHTYNRILDGNPVDDPQWPQRLGTALAVFAQMCLSASIQHAYTQLVWLSVKQQSYEIRTLNALFSICYSPTNFLNPKLYREAMLSVIIASLVWLVPLCSIVAPASLTSISGLLNSNMTCNISTLDFQRENGYNAENINAPGQASALFSLDPNDNLTFYYNSPSMDLKRFFELASLSDSGFLKLPNPCQSGSNCSYNYSFDGPSYNCQERADFANSTSLNKSMLIPTGEWLYLSPSQTLEDPYGRPDLWLDMTADNETDIGTFFEEPSLWIGYVDNTTERLDVDASAAWYYRMEPHVFECILYNATYNYTMTFINGDMNIGSLAVYPVSPLLSAGSTMPPTDPNYEAFSAYHAVGFLYRRALSGNMSQTSDHGLQDYAISNSAIQEIPGLLDPDTQAPLPDFPSRVERQFSNIILSLAADLNLYSQVNITTQCPTSTIVLKWKYKPFWLVLTYFLAASATILAVGVGLHSFRENGYSADTSFGTFLTTTRNPTLDRLSQGYCLGQANLPQEFTGQRLRFGQVSCLKTSSSKETLNHVAFGLPDETTSIILGENYA
ncbi:hypothetical protein BP5796_08523 [Coleophoma crateriformis]|uniref:Uncharacterized protein n=1 Tax=Coleophoma crateriformis TaxID=565419 RepID=A0A3D8R828_9HELO|nr:hypothetical protein BP5796_08523 [Coleophoma crateriformis]